MNDLISRSMTHRPVVSRGIAFVVSLAVVFGALELGLRAFGPFLPGTYRTGPLFEPDEQLGWRNVAGSTVWLRRGDEVVRLDVNAEGHVGPLGPPGGSQFRILLLGDSYLVGPGLPYDRTFGARLQAMLPRTVDVVNAAVVGYGTDQETLLFECTVARELPHVVVVMFAVANDVWNNDWTLESRVPTGPKPRFELEGDSTLERVPRPPVTILESGGMLLARSRLLSALKTGLVDRLVGRGLRRDQLGILEEPQGEWLRAWQLTELILERLWRDSVTADVRLLLVLAPDSCQLDADQCKDAPSLRASTVPQERISEVARRLSMPVLDLLPTFREHAAAGELLYLPGDVHWSPQGHQLAATRVLKDLRVRDWLP